LIADLFSDGAEDIDVDIFGGAMPGRPDQHLIARLAVGAMESFGLNCARKALSG
jgi:hypothetical protein